MKKIILSILLVLIVGCGVWFTLNKEKQKNLSDSSLQGKWFNYGDCPTTIFTFSGNNKVNLKSCDGEYGDIENRTGVYKITNEKVVVSIEKDIYEFMPEYVENEMKLKLIDKGQKGGVVYEEYMFSKKKSQ